jgi:hypothetical protein
MIETSITLLVVNVVTMAQRFRIGVLAVYAIVASGYVRYRPEEAYVSYRRIVRLLFHSAVMTRAA